MTPFIESLPLKPQTLEIIEYGFEIVTQNNSDKEYHGPDHPLEVLEDTILVVDEIKPPNVHEPYLLVDDAAIAAVFHDAILYLGSGSNERASAKLAQDAMRRFGSYTERRIHRVGTMIISTITEHLESGEIIHPLLGSDKPSRALVCGDMANLGKEPRIAKQKTIDIFQERFPGEPLDGQKMYEFLVKQIVLLRTFEFPIPAAKRLFPHQQENLAEVIKWRAELGAQLDIAA